MLLSLYEVDTKEISSGSSDHNTFLVIYAVIELTFEKGGPTFSSFNPCLPLPSCATETVSIPKYIVLNKKTGMLFWN